MKIFFKVRYIWDEINALCFQTAFLRPFFMQKPLKVNLNIAYMEVYVQNTNFEKFRNMHSR